MPENKTTTVQVQQDVYDELLKRKDIKQSFNDVLRELLDLPDPNAESFKPHYYQGIIEIRGLNLAGMEHITKPIINHRDYNGNISDRMMINGIDAWVDVIQLVTITIKAETEEEVKEKAKTLLDMDKIPEVVRRFVEFHTEGLMQVDCRTGKRLDKPTHPFGL